MKCIEEVPFIRPGPSEPLPWMKPGKWKEGRISPSVAVLNPDFGF